MRLHRTRRATWIPTLAMAAALWLGAGDAAAETTCGESSPHVEGLRICAERTVPDTWSWVPQQPGYDSEEAKLAAQLALPDDDWLLRTPFTCRPYPIGRDRQTAAVVAMLVTPRESVCRSSGSPADPVFIREKAI